MHALLDKIDIKEGEWQREKMMLGDGWAHEKKNGATKGPKYTHTHIYRHRAKKKKEINTSENWKPQKERNKNEAGNKRTVKWLLVLGFVYVKIF
jgi:hypothetical protein